MRGVVMVIAVSAAMGGAAFRRCRGGRHRHAGAVDERSDDDDPAGRHDEHDDLDAALAALASVSPRVAAVRSRLARATPAHGQARAVCRGGDVKRTRKLLKGTFQKLGKTRASLASKANRPCRDATACSRI